MRHQINIPLTAEQRDTLDAAVFVRGLRSAQPLIDPLLQELIAELQADDDVVAALELRLSKRKSKPK